MSRVKTEIWVPSKEDKSKGHYLPRQSKDVFQDLVKELKSADLYPDEYILMEEEFKRGAYQTFPELCDLYCYTRWGGSEGIYTNIDVQIYDKEEGRYKNLNFISAKSLGETEEAFDRMQYIAGYIYRLLMGDGSVRARYIVFQNEPEKNHRTLLSRTAKEFTDYMKEKLYGGEEVQAYSESLALKAMIIRVLPKCQFPEDKLEELLKQEKILEALVKLCKPVMAANDAEIEDILASYRSLEDADKAN